MSLISLSLDQFVDSALSSNGQRFDGEQRRTKILAAAIQECSEKGFAAASMASIAKRARVSTASLYRDFGIREKLLDDTTVFAAPMISAELVAPVDETRPRERMVALLIRQCQVFDHPHASWLFRAYVGGVLDDSSQMRQLGQMARTNIEAFWRSELSSLQERGLLQIPQMDEAINFVLGTVYRRTLLAMLLFGANDVAEPDVETAAQSAVNWLFAQFETQPSSIGSVQ